MPPTMQLTYRPPFDWTGLLEFLSPRALAGVELIRDGQYLRTVRLGAHSGWIRVRRDANRHMLLIGASASLTPVMPIVRERLHCLFDVDARPDLIEAQLAGDSRLGRAVSRNPGLRVPGAFDGFEMAFRAILGQQITVKAAATLAARVVDAMGEPIGGPHPELTRLCPTPERIAAARVPDLASLGIIRMRSRSLIAMAERVAAGRLRLEPGVEPAAAVRGLLEVPGIGPWTAQYIAMRALRWPDAFPKEDIVLRRRLGGVSPARAEMLAQAWRPWRSYAALHLWQSDGEDRDGGRSRSRSRRPRARTET